MTSKPLRSPVPSRPALLRSFSMTHGLRTVLLVFLVALSSGYAHSQEIIEFELSDSVREDQMNSFMSLLLDPAANPSGQTAVTIPGSMPWFDTVSYLRLVLGAKGSTPIVSSVFLPLRDVRLDETGYSWMGFTAHGWPFPNYEHSQGQIPGWEFDGATTEGWTSANLESSTVANGLWTIETNHVDPLLISPNTSFDATLCPIVRVFVSCDSGGAACELPHRFKLFWKTQASPTFDEAKSLYGQYLSDAEIPPSVPHDFITEYPIFVGEDTDWTGTITALRFDPTNQAQPTTFEIDRIVCAFDTRRTSHNPNFIKTLLNYHRATAKTAVFDTVNTYHGTFMDKAREVFQFMWDDLGGGANNYIRVDWPGHDGVRGLLPGNTLNVGHGIGEGLNDIWPYGWDSAPATLGFYESLLAMAELESRAAELGAPPNPYGHTAASLEAKADLVADEFGSRFWSSTTGRIRSSIDIEGTPHDIGDVSLNMAAVTSGILDETEALSVMTWLDGQRTVAGDTSQGSDIYHWDFAPRSNTKDVEPESYLTWVVYIWFGVNLNGGGNYNDAVNNGGGWLRNTHDDIVARALTLGADNAWARMEDVLDWYQDAVDAGGFRQYYDNLGVTVQGCGTAGAVLVDCEGAVEGATAPLAFLDAFVGITQKGEDGLRFAPLIPTALDSVGAQRYFYKDHFYDVSAMTSGSVIRYIATHPDTGIPQYPNAAHTLRVEFAGLQPIMTYTLRVHDLDAGTSSDSTETTNGQGALVFDFQMPENGRIELLGDPQNPGNVIFEDDFESGTLSAWDEVAP